MLSIEEVNIIMHDVNPKHTAQNMSYFDNNDQKYGAKKVKCTEHHIVETVLTRLNVPKQNVESVSIVYYPTGSINGMHADNCIIENGLVKQIKPWTHTGIIFLNNNFTGGILHYPNQGCLFKPVIGTMVITPAGIDYMHEVTKVESGERFTLVFRFI